MINIFTSVVQLMLASGINQPYPGIFSINSDTAIIKKTTDFTITGKGDNEAWNKTGWHDFIKIDSGTDNYVSKSKMLYSEKGIYILFSGEDQLITTKNYKDDDDIYEGDVFEVFFQTDETKHPYFEYEINQLGRQLVLLLSGSKNKNLAWSPWRHEYEKHPVILKKVVVAMQSKNTELVERNDAIKPGAAIRSWTAEIFFPYEVFGLLPSVPPQSGMIWRGNFCRIDYDNNKTQEWTWSKKIKSNFHELKNFGYLLFE